MAFNGDGPFNKRMRTDGESVGQKSNVHYYTDNDYYTPDQNDGDNNGPYGGFSDYDNQPRRRKGEPETPNHVLLMTILNPAYPITVDVIHTICQPYGNVLRIVIFKKNGVQAMVEFDGIDPATRAREGLQGADIYSGCCTLRIEYAKPSKLNVYKNDAESWDFTNPNVAVCQCVFCVQGEAPARPHLQEPSPGPAPPPPPDHGTPPARPRPAKGFAGHPRTPYCGLARHVDKMAAKLKH